MPAPIVASSFAPAPSPRPSAPAAVATPPSSFRDHLAEAARSLGASERAADGALERVARGGAMGAEQLIAFQATIYRYSLSMDIASKVVEKATSAVRQTLQSQQG